MRPRSIVKPFKIFAASEIIIIVHTYGNVRISIQMAQPVRATFGLTCSVSGRPRKHPSGWEQTVRRICISNTAYLQWQEVKSERSLLNDDSVARFLLTFYKDQ